MKKEASRESWLNRLSTLNVGRQKYGLAPHKPLLILAVMDHWERGEWTDGLVGLNPELTFTFHDFWTVVASRCRSKPDIRLPFHHLGGERDRVWEPLTQNGDPSASRETTRMARLDPELCSLIMDTQFREQARIRLIEAYFSPQEKVILYTRLGLPLPDSAEIHAMKEDVESYRKSLQKGRDQRFKTLVVSGYNHTCALTGYRLITGSSSLVVAAHIQQHAATGNDDPQNGLALTPDAHWLFDQFLWSVDPSSDSLLIHVAHERFADLPEHGRSLRYQHNQPLRFAPHARLRPNPCFLQWHWERFQRAGR